MTYTLYAQLGNNPAYRYTTYMSTYQAEVGIEEARALEPTVTFWLEENIQADY